MIHISISEELKKELQEEANALEMPLTAYIRMILIERKK